MVKLVQTIVCVFFMLSKPAEFRRVTAGRMKDGQVTPERKEAHKCVVKGQERNDKTKDMSVTVPVESCITQCFGKNPFAEFRKTFTSHLVPPSPGSTSLRNWCVCSAGGKQMVKFDILDKTKSALCEKGDSDDMQKQCWELYIKKCGEFKADSWSATGDQVQVTGFKSPFQTGDFTIACDGKCYGDECYSVSIPATIDGASDELKEHLRGMLKEFNKHGHGDLTDTQSEEIEQLTDGEICALIDVDGDGTISIAELEKFFPDDKPATIRACATELDGDADGKLTCDEFNEFQDCLRKANAAPGAASTGDEDTDEEAPKWKATEIRCKVGGEVVDDESVCGTEEEKAAFLAALQEGC